MTTERSYDERHQAALEVLARMRGGDGDAERAAMSMSRRHGRLGSYAVDYVLGDLWSRPQLSRRDRSLIVVAILTWLGKHHELEFHIPGALHHGVSRQELTEVMVQMCVYGGFPRAVDGIRTLQQTFDRIDAA